MKNGSLLEGLFIKLISYRNEVKAIDELLQNPRYNVDNIEKRKMLEARIKLMGRIQKISKMIDEYLDKLDEEEF